MISKLPMGLRALVWGKSIYIKSKKLTNNYLHVAKEEGCVIERCTTTYSLNTCPTPDLIEVDIYEKGRYFRFKYENKYIHCRRPACCRRNQKK